MDPNIAQNENQNADQPMAGTPNAPSSNAFGDRSNPAPNPFLAPNPSGYAPQPQFPNNPFPPSGAGFGQTAPHTQGPFPQGFSFGSIQSTTGSNFGFNPTTVSGPPTPFYQQAVPSGSYPGATQSVPALGGPMAEPWGFNENLCFISHRGGTCPQCDSMRTHIITAMSVDDSSYSAAAYARAEYFRRSHMGSSSGDRDSASLHHRIGELEGQLTVERSMNDRWHQAN